jgi:hypothetical protein
MHLIFDTLAQGHCVLQIIIWDNDKQRIAEIDKNLHVALNELKLKALILSNSEPPSIARENLLNRLPVLEIEGRYWSMRPGSAFSKKDCISLLSRFK